MKIFKNFPEKTRCIICNEEKDGRCVLIPIVGTGDNPTKKFQNYEAKPIHLDCLHLWLDKSTMIIYQRLEKTREVNDGYKNQNINRSDT